MNTPINIARIEDGIVANIEVATNSWITENEDTTGTVFVDYATDEIPHIDLTYDAVTGFEQPIEEEVSQ